jgi:hypothetical protein
MCLLRLMGYRIEAVETHQKGDICRPAPRIEDLRRNGRGARFLQFESLHLLRSCRTPSLRRLPRSPRQDVLP